MPTCHNTISMTGDYQPIEIENLQEEVRQLVIINDDLSTKLEEAAGISNKLAAKLWEWEAKQPPSFSLYRSYELQRDLFFLLHDYKLGQELNEDEFVLLWLLAKDLKKENLLSEICTRKDLKLQKFTGALITMGDLGARNLLYYRDLEQQINLKRQIDHAVMTTRQLDLRQYHDQVMRAFQEGQMDTEIRQDWKERIEPLLIELEDKEALGKTLRCVLEREGWARRGELTNSHYVYTIDKALNRLKQAHDKLSLNLNPRINLDSMTTMAYSVRPYSSGLLVNVTVDQPSEQSQSSLRARFVGHMEAVFVTALENEYSVPTWQALEWLVEDFGMTRTIRLAEDRQYQLVSGSWPEGVPISVSTDPRYCAMGQRRGKWSPDATLESTNYNWPVIGGQFNTWDECAASYHHHYMLHKDHQDGVCFRSAVYSRILSFWCTKFKFKMNVNAYDPVQPAFILMLKIQYHCARWKRILETMAITGFIAGIHPCFINETFKDTRRNPFGRFLEYQRTKNWSLVQEDDDVRKAVRKQQAEVQRKEIQDQYNSHNQHRHR